MALEPQKTTPTPADIPPPANTGPEDEKPSEFETAFDEFAGPEDPGPADGEGEQGEGQSQIEDQPGASPAPDTSTSQKPPATGDEKNQILEALWKDAPPKARAAYEAAQKENQALLQENRSHRGRFSRFAREHPEFFNKDGTARPAAETRPPASGATAPTATKPAEGAKPDHVPTDAEAASMDDVEWAEFAKDYPDVAAPIAKRLDALTAQNAQLVQELGGISTERREANLSRQFGILVDKHSDWDKIYGSEKFERWLSTQPDYVVSAAVRNGEVIVDGEEAAHIVTLFKAATGYVPAAPQPANQPGPKPAEAPSNPGPSRRRQRRLQSAVHTPNRGVGAGSGPPEDFETAFDYYAAKAKP